MLTSVSAGKTIWIEQDKERSKFSFSPRKGIIVRVIPSFPKKEAILVELLPPPFIWRFYPSRLKHVLLTYLNEDEDSIDRTFRVGLSVAETFRLKKNFVATEHVPKETDISRIGIAIVRPWPIPSADEMKKRVSGKSIS